MVWKKKDKKISEFSHEIACCCPYMEQKEKFFFKNGSKMPFPFPIWCGKKKIKRFLPKCTTPIVLMV